MNYIDVVILIILAIYGLTGFFKGFVRSLISLIGFITAVYLSFRFFLPLANFMHAYLGFSLEILSVLSFIFLFLLIVIIASLIGNKIHGMLSKTSLGLINRIIGVIFGLLKGMVILSLLIALISWSDPEGKYLDLTDRQQSRLYYPTEKIASSVLNYLLDMIPAELKNEWQIESSPGKGDMLVCGTW